MSARDKERKAVQILRTNDDRSFELNESQLQAILLDDRVRDKPVVVVSIAGAFCQGKSFLLNFFLRYLRKNGRSNWLEDKNIPLGGFEWKSGSDPHTTGIMLWNEVFLVTTPQGEEVAVLLMDTQGSFGCKSSVKDCTTIFALSVMTSSVLIYNVFRNIQEDQLQHLQFFAEYGRVALKESKGEPFQRLVFLVRDWPFPYEADYGLAGGRTILKKRLQITDDQHGDLRGLRQQISSCFSQIDCFLMPRPGDKVETDESFKGCLDDINHMFKQKLQELLPWILAPENIVVKEINGQKITCRELMDYFRAYARVFLGGTLPRPKSVLQVTTVASNVAAKEKAVEFYLEGMKTLPRGNLQQMMNADDSLRKKATEFFRSTPKFCDECVSQRYLEVLEKEMQLHFSRIFMDEKDRERERALQKRIEEERQWEIKREAEREKQRQLEIKREEEREEQRKLERKREEEREKQRQLERGIEAEKEKQRQREREREMREQLRQREREIEEEGMKQGQGERKREEKESEIEKQIRQAMETAGLFLRGLDAASSVGQDGARDFRRLEGP